MALTADIALNPTTYGGANVSKTYSLLGYSGLSESTRRVAATAVTTPETLVIKHRKIKVLDCDTDQHLVRLDINAVDPVKGRCQLSVREIIEVPQGTTVFTSQMILDIQGRLIALLQTSGVLDKLLNSEA